MYVSVIIVRKDTLEILLITLTRFCRFLKGAFRRKSPLSKGRSDRLKPGKSKNLTDVSVFNITGFIFREQKFFRRAFFSLNHLIKRLLQLPRQIMNKSV